MLHLESIFLHSESVGGCNAGRVPTPSVSSDLKIGPKRTERRPRRKKKEVKKKMRTDDAQRGHSTVTYLLRLKQRGRGEWIFASKRVGRWR